MMQAMKGATMALGSMNRQMNLPGLTKIAMEFEKENDIMEQRQEMMDDAIDDAMDVGAEEEGEEVVEQVLEEIGVDLNQAVRTDPVACPFPWAICLCWYGFAVLLTWNIARGDAYGVAGAGGAGGKGCAGDWGWGRDRGRRLAGAVG